MHGTKSTDSSSPSNATQKLEALRALGGTPLTTGLPDEVIERFLAKDPALGQAIDRAWEAYEGLKDAHADLLAADEAEQLTTLQDGIVNFYGRPLLNPYVALGAGGPWIVTAKGAVIHDSGGYGMLGLGHTPAAILEAMAQPMVMANVMTPHFAQARLISALRREIGQRRDGGCPYTGFLFMNSGSESVTVGSRIVDVNAKIQTDPGGRHAGKKIRRASLKGSFHGRTYRAAHYSDSSGSTYRETMASFRDSDPLLTVPPNDVDALRAAFATAEQDGEFIEAFFMEPVMGEGNPGMAVSREFYDAARSLTRAHGALLLMDSIQAGLRAHGVLSIVDYPGFEDCEPPDLETYSKALNAGQYPMSVLAMTESAAALYRVGIYGNTMTAAPRAMVVGATVLESITPELRQNIVDRGREFVELLEKLAAEPDLNGAILKIQGTGLLVSCGLDPERYLCHGSNSTEEYLRTKGFGVIHGGKSALRYTPHFAVPSEELHLIVDSIRDALLNGPHK